MIFLPCDNIVDYENINPIKYVPAFVDEDFVVSDSLAIILVQVLPKSWKFHGMKLSILMVSKLQTARGSSIE